MPIFNHGLPVRANVIQGEGGTDTSKDTVTPETLLEGVTAHNAAGEPIVGTCDYNANTESDTVTAEKLVLGETAHDASGQPVTGTLDTEAIRAEGYTEGKAAGIEAGKQKQLEDVRDKIQGENGSRSYYPYFFWASYPYDLIPPKYPVKFGGSWSGRQAFAWNNTIKEILVDIIMAGADIGGSCFEGSKNLHTIKKIVMESGTIISLWFDGCTALVNLTIEGTIGQNGFNVSWSPLSKASLISIVNALSSTTTGLTVTVRASAVKKAFETSEGANDGMSSEEWLTLVSTKPNWTINAIDS